MSNDFLEGSRVQELRKKCKNLFQSPSVELERNPEVDDAVMLKLKLQIDQSIESGCQSIQRDLHEDRLKHLRQKLKTLSEDDWRYPPIEKLIGLQ